MWNAFHLFIKQKTALKMIAQLMIRNCSARQLDRSQRNKGQDLIMDLKSDYCNRDEEEIMRWFHYAKVSGNFGPNVNGMVRPRWKFSGQSCKPPEVVLFDRLVRSDRKLLFYFQKFPFPVPPQLTSSSLHTVVSSSASAKISLVGVFPCVPLSSLN